MKKLFFFTVVALLALNANAKVWRVNNTVGIKADFQSPQAANDSSYVLAGDTIYIEGSLTNYPGFYISKPLVIFGPGYFLSENPKTQYSKLSATIPLITLRPNSRGSVISGITIGTAYSGTALYICDSNIIIKNNFIRGDVYISNMNWDGSDYPYFTNIKIAENYIKGTVQTHFYPYGQFTKVLNVFISNNYIYGGLKFANSNTGLLMNNIIEGGNIETYNFSYLNNIIVSGSLSDTTTNTYMYNLCNGAQLPVNGNIRNVNMTNVFIDPIGNSTDGKWQLVAGSPAIGAASDGGNCGMFGGVDPYKLSGVSGPSIYNITMPSAGTPANGINVTVKVKAN